MVLLDESPAIPSELGMRPLKEQVLYQRETKFVGVPEATINSQVCACRYDTL